MFRYRITFTKTSAMRFTSHLDVHRTWERTIRRARLPLAYSQGFNPQPKIQLAAALPLGFVSQCELADIYLEDNLPAETVLMALRAAAPPGLGMVNAVMAEAREPALQSVLQAADYVITLPPPVPADLDDRLAALLAQTSLPRTRRDKTYDLRPRILTVTRLDETTLAMRLTASEAATGRPDETLSALGLDPLSAVYHRTALWLTEPTGPITPWHAAQA